MRKVSGNGGVEDKLDEAGPFTLRELSAKYATTPNQISLSNLAIEYCAHVNSELQPGKYAKQKLASIIAEVDPYTEKLRPRMQFVFESLMY